ncbi:hypothetical protein SAMN04488134_11435 [Amphibacillus marinus]|uniref:Cytokinin riboside 5'-monophosphate phosphoribohydrolase n=1 Tax=Amphibacillus marinus TaxID=872970 RepID=A0A1H8T1V5_9BACI|nr:TIGR00730 family Rossman fold protein [Amphibacillus marinus]SEO84574.1 hypothetical protein SAMN04488134_11435 [Amphibacillus marinus]
MNIVVYCGASIGNNTIYKSAAEELAKWIADNNHRLIYGGGKVGLMGILANKVIEYGGEVTGIIPTFLVDRELSHDNLTNLVIVNSMSERKNKMIELGDCYIALPGGPGTLEEISEVISWARIGQHSNPCILFNKGGYYDNLQRFFDDMINSAFLSELDRKYTLFSNSTQEIEDFINNYVSPQPRSY